MIRWEDYQHAIIEDRDLAPFFQVPKANPVLRQGYCFAPFFFIPYYEKLPRFLARHKKVYKSGYKKRMRGKRIPPIPWKQKTKPRGQDRYQKLQVEEAMEKIIKSLFMQGRCKTLRNIAGEVGYKRVRKWIQKLIKDGFICKSELGYELTKKGLDFAIEKGFDKRKVPNAFLPQGVPVYCYGHGDIIGVAFLRGVDPSQIAKGSFAIPPGVIRTGTYTPGMHIPSLRLGSFNYGSRTK
jgi:predicted transcriptional regulator